MSMTGFYWGIQCLQKIYKIISILMVNLDYCFKKHFTFPCSARCLVSFSFATQQPSIYLIAYICHQCFRLNWHCFEDLSLLGIQIHKASCSKSSTWVLDDSTWTISSRSPSRCPLKYICRVEVSLRNPVSVAILIMPIFPKIYMYVPVKSLLTESWQYKRNDYPCGVNGSTYRTLYES